MTPCAIGTVRSPFTTAVGTPIQTTYAEGAEGTIEIFEPFVAGLKDLEGFDRIWVLYWCHMAAEPRLRVVPYRDVVEHGVFATRAPARPTPIGLSPVRLLQVCGNVLQVAELDILDGAPVLDIKPYVPEYDVRPAARCGWLDAAGAHKEVVRADARFQANVRS